MAKGTRGCVVCRQWAEEAGHGGRGLRQGAMRCRGLMSRGLTETSLGGLEMGRDEPQWAGAGALGGQDEKQQAG